MHNQKSLATPLLTWFEQHGRHDLPWQKNPTPYRVWISEIMLQQTQVATVIPYYQKFIRRFSSSKTLALAPEDEVLAYWSGLGYYRRARNLHRTAQLIHHHYHGRFPTTVNELMQLPGIGRSTAGAILSLGMNKPAAILDGNVKRVLTRYHAIPDWPGKTNVIDQLWRLAEKYTAWQRCRDYNQAIMDLGALLCTRTKPQCHRCPLCHSCEAHQQGQETHYPIKKSKSLPRREKATRMLLLVNSDHEILLEKRPSQGIWGGLWSFPECPMDSDVMQWGQEHFQCQILSSETWPRLSHAFTHFQLEIEPVVLKIKRNHTKCPPSWAWCGPNKVSPGGRPAPVIQLLKKFYQQ
ncbi:MAG: A/G-specific adenine glycosylase [Coxiella sp. RIFCSPHIGHO2_12_FULL_44_14]|nr:MAG: A/G-specific adenine glycosylase [Coxiella sp. RIFCSPHIGHO2_12_FULL_44_14]